MRLYVEVTRSTLRRATTYRWATFAGVVTNTVFGFILAYVLLAVFAERDSIGGFDVTDAVTFTFVRLHRPVERVLGPRRARSPSTGLDHRYVPLRHLLPTGAVPGWLEAAARSLPFASMMQLPVEVFLGKHQGGALVGVFALQALWLAALVALVALGRIVLARATRKVVIQGG